MTVDRLQPGIHIRLPVKWNQHPFLFNSFKIKSQEQIQLIKRLGIQYVYVNPAQSDTQPLPVDSAQPEISEEEGVQVDSEAQKLWEEKQKQIEKLNIYRRRVLRCEKEFERSLAQMRSVMSKIRNRPADAIDEAALLVDNIVEKLLSDGSVTLHLMNGKNDFEDIYFHSLNVAVIGMMIGKAKGYGADKIKALAFAALFHDMGKIKVPTAIIRKKTALTDPESNYLKLHTKYGLDIAANIEDFPDSAKRVIEQHHELNDGSGYPQALKESQIDELAQIVSVANAYDNLCHTNIESEQKIPYIALSYLYKNCKHLYSNENLSILIKFMGVFPPGTVVQLDDDSIGLVISVNAQQLLYPNVLIYDPTVPRSQAPIIDLADRDLKIVNAMLPHKLPDKVREYLNPRARISYFFDNDD